MLKTETFNIKNVHQMVQRAKNAGIDVRWDNWDVVFHRPSEQGRTSPQGAYRNGQWGFENRFAVDSEGKWNIDARNLSGLRRSGYRRK